MYPARRGLIEALFPEGMPGLWCPSLTHFDAQGRIDPARIEKHLARLAPHARGLLVPGSTGEGWQLTDREARELLTIVIQAAQRWKLHVLIGAFKHQTTAVIQAIDEAMQWLQTLAGTQDWLEIARQTRVVGFTVCPPRGDELTQDQILAALEQVLQLRHPTALYQLPQVTENEISPATFLQLVERYPNLYLLKDTSGQDWIARAGIDPGGVFLVRGAEGGYSRWLKPAGGPYDGLLLSSANNFAPQLAEVQRLVADGRREEADALSQRIDRVVSRCFEIVAGVAMGNPFTNANKLLDHVMAYGEDAARRPPPVLHGGVPLPRELIEPVAAALQEQQLFPECGYLAAAPPANGAT
ncbi:MAG TPA: dihydrodipicolinate synthase family protein [Candidatus Anammoximicrobium sp.]|nr:dihydrodipicolinate synthase family protein [Candidatus Anammoximicrobium sp.]